MLLGQKSVSQLDPKGDRIRRNSVDTTDGGESDSISLDSYPTSVDFEDDVAGHTAASLINGPTEDPHSLNLGRCWRNHFIKVGLRFEDRRWELEYLHTALNAKSSRTFALVAKCIFILAVAALTWTYADQNTVTLEANILLGENVLWASGVCVLWLSLMGFCIVVSVALHCCRLWSHDPRRKVCATTSATLVALLAAAGFAPYGYAAQQLYLYMYEHTVITFVNNVSFLNYTEFDAACSAINLSSTSLGYPGPSAEFSSPTVQAGEVDGHYNDTAFSAISTQTRLCVQSACVFYN